MSNDLTSIQLQIPKDLNTQLKIKAIEIGATKKDLINFYLELIACSPTTAEVRQAFAESKFSRSADLDKYFEESKFSKPKPAQ